jgi:hypothetical protein
MEHPPADGIMPYLIIFVVLIFTGCSSLYPIGGAIVGGGAGSLGGPVTAAVGAGAGAAAGQILAKDSETSKLKDHIQALTTGDVNKLVELRMEEAKSSGFFDSILDEFYSLMKLVCLGLILWNAIPIVWTYLLKKEVKVIQKNGTATKG